MKYQCSVPVIATADVRATIGYYCRVLGFTEQFVYADPPVYAGVSRDSALLYITRDEKFANLLKGAELHPDVFLWVENLDEVFAEHKSRAAKIVEPIADRPWDARQYVIEDPNGYHLKFAEPLDEE